MSSPPQAALARLSHEHFFEPGRLYERKLEADLARYYAQVAPAMLPHLRGRPVSMQRFPDGVSAGGFFEKKRPGHFPDGVGAVEVETRDGAQDQVVVTDERSLVHLAGQACVTPHVWLSTSDASSSPTSTRPG